MSTVAQALALQIAEIARLPLLSEVSARARVLLLDFLGVALGGVHAESTVALRRGLELLGTSGDATTVGVRARFAPPHAALANGAAAHALEMDDTHQGGSIHLGAAVFPAALAAAELVGASGETVLRAAVAGYEVAARLAMALKPQAHYARGFHPTGTCGAFGAAAAAGVVLGLDAAALAHALGVAGSQAAGSMEFLADGAWTKRLHPGWAACAGLHAAAVARAGFRGPASIFEGRFGTLHAYSDDSEVDLLTTAGERELMRTSIKPHACCRYLQGPIDAALMLRERIAVSEIEQIEFDMLAAGFPIVCEPIAAKRAPRSDVDAQFSLPFAIAIALLRGAASPGEVTATVATDPVVVDLMARVHGVRDAALDAHYPRAWPAWVRIVLRDGRVEEEQVLHPRGDPENFPTRQELEGKFLTLGSRTLAAAQLERVVAAVDAFPTTRHTGELLATLVPDR